MSVVSRHRSRKILATTVGALSVALSLSLAGCAGSPAASSSSQPAGPVELTWFQGSGVEANTSTMEALAEAFHAKNPDITIKVDASGPSGSPDIDNTIKTKLATGSMPDMFWYNSGSLLSALNPDETMLDVSGEAFLRTSTPASSSRSPPRTACSAHRRSQQVAAESSTTSRSTRSSAWRSPRRGTSSSPTRRRSRMRATRRSRDLRRRVDLADRDARRLLQRLRQRFGLWARSGPRTKSTSPTTRSRSRASQSCRTSTTAGFLNEDFASAKLDDGLKAIATGTAANYPMLGFAQATIVANYPDNAEDVGFFGIPGDSADSAGMTVWMPSAVYAPTNTPHPDAVKEFMAFVASPEGCDVVTETLGVTGPTWSRAARSPTTLRGSSPTCCRTSSRSSRARARVPVAGEGTEPGSSHRRGRLGHP